MFVFAIFGSVFGFWEEIPAFSIVIVPLFVLAGYDVMTGLAVLTVGATAGNMASVVNPFSTDAAIGAIGNPELSLGSGMVLRLILFVLLYVVGLFFTVKYANEVKKNKNKSLVADIDVKTLTHEQGHLPELTKKRFWSLMILIGIIVLLILGYMPWYEIKFTDGSNFQDVINMPIYLLAKMPLLGNLLGAKYITPLGDWYFGEFSFVFFLGSLLIGFINKMPEEKFVKEFVSGAKDLLGVVLVLAIANGISVLMGSKTSGMSVTFVYWIQSALQGIPAWAFDCYSSSICWNWMFFTIDKWSCRNNNANTWSSSNGIVSKFQYRGDRWASNANICIYIGNKFYVWNLPGSYNNGNIRVI